MPLAGTVAQMIGVRFGQYLGRRLVLGACRDDADDEFDARPFVPRIAPAALPAGVDLRRWTTPVEEQGSLGSCTSNALAAAVEYLVHRATGRAIDVSRLFVYYNQRLWGDYVRDDLGASIGSGVRVLSRLGVPLETSWPYHPDLFAVQPPEPVYAAAARHRAIDWWRVPVERDALRACLAGGFPIAFGTRIFESFVQMPRGGAAPMPRRGERDHGRHAMLLVGYHDASRRFIVRNSWGEDWGDAGHAYVPYELMLQPGWTRDCWAVRLTADVDFDPRAHVPLDPSTLPKAPPRGRGSDGTIGAVAGMGAGVVVSAVTGSGLLGGLVGGLAQGVLPALVGGARRNDGAVVGRDRATEIRAALGARDGPPGLLTHHAWDDGYDEEAVVAPGPVPVARTPTAPTSNDRRAPSVDPAVERLHERTPSLGEATSEILPIADGPARGHAVRCEGGAIFHWDGEAAFALERGDALYERWLELGAARAPPGWPAAAPTFAPDYQGRVLRCTRGVLIWSAAHGAREIHGPIFALWEQMRGLGGALGYPISDQEDTGDPERPQRSRFENGVVYWSPRRGAWAETRF